MRFENGLIFVGGRFVSGGFSVEDGRFAHVLADEADGEGVDLRGARVIPGLVDVHTHGNSGADFSDGDYDGLVKMAAYLAKNGVTSFAPASMTLPYDVLETAFRTAVRLHRTAPKGCARLLGIQMEGPFFSEKKKGAQNAAYLRLPDYDAFARLYNAAEGLLRMWRRSFPARWNLPAAHRKSVPSPWPTPTPPTRRPPPFLTREPPI